MTAHVRMIDVSANNHSDGLPIDWPAVKAAGYGAVMIKSSEGVWYGNPWLKRDADAAAAAGLLVGFYHFAHPGQNVADFEANNAMATVGLLHHDLGLALDFEVAETRTWAQLEVFAHEFHNRVLQGFEHSPLYVNDYFLDNLNAAAWGWRIWLAQTARPRFEVWAWQETTPIAVPGIAGLTDVGWLRPAA